MTFKRSSIDKALPHAGFYPDSQDLHSDAAKIDIISESCKYFDVYFKFLNKTLPYSITFCIFASKRDKMEEETFLKLLYQSMRDSAREIRLTTGRPSSHATRQQALEQVAMLKAAKEAQ